MSKTSTKISAKTSIKKNSARPSARPVVFVLFGATGDLAQKKILPALDALYGDGSLPSGSHVIAVSRRDWDDDGLFEFLDERGVELSQGFRRILSYARVDIDAGTGYGELAEIVTSLQEAAGGPTKMGAVYHTALAPTLHGRVAEALREAGLLGRAERPKKGAKAAETDVNIAPKLLIEKPFGTDTRSACELDQLLHGFLDESQIYRIDHYLGKDAIRAIMDLHENAPDFDGLISAESVSRIRIGLFETKGIDGRGASYDGVGAFRDVGQNHMLEMLGTVAAEIGRSESGPEWQTARTRAIEQLEPPIKTCALSRRGQYEGYAAEKGVASGSQTETAFEVITTFATGKLKGTEVILEAGKRMPESEAFIEIEFRDIPGLPRSMRFSVQPAQEVVITGRDGSSESFAIPARGDAYENVIRAAIEGKDREFAGREEIEALWGYADHVVACWGKVPLQIYSQSRPFLVQ